MAESVPSAPAVPAETADESSVRPRGLRTAGLAFVIALTGAATPGPMLALVIGQTLAHRSLLPAMYILIGHALLESVFVVGLAFGISRVLSRQRVRGALAVCGGLALGWMGLDILAHVPGMSMSTAGDHARSWYALVVGGIGVSLSNPYFTGWWATVGTGQVAALGLRRPRDYAWFFVGHELGDAAWFLFVASLLVLGSQWLTDSLYRGLLYGCGGTIVVVAAVFLVLGVRCLVISNGTRRGGGADART